MLARSLRYVVRYWKLHTLVLFLSLCAAGLAVLHPKLWEILIDDVLSGPNPGMFAIVLFAYAATHVADLAVEIVRHYISTLAGNRSVVDLRNDIVTHLRRLPLLYFYKERTGRIMSVMTDDAPAMEGLFRSILPNIVLHTTILLSMAITIVQSRHLTLIITAFCMIPFYIIVPARLAKTFRQAFRRVQEGKANISATLQESIVSTKEVVAYGRTDWDRRRLSDLFGQDLSQRLRAILMEARYGGVQNLLGFVSPVLILLVGGPAVMRGDLTVGFLLAFQLWTSTLYGNARSLYDAHQQVQRALGAAERVFSFLDEPIDPIYQHQGRSLANPQGSLRFGHVRFSYDGTRNVFDDLNLDVPAGTTVALIGPSGGGKSTLVNLALRFFDPDSGTVYFDGVDLKELDVHWYRNQVGVVFQDTFIFAGTLYDNIAFAMEGATPEDVKRAAQIAHVDEFVGTLPDGYQTILGEQGTRLSGGQRQRIAIARAVIRNPKLLILDEATSALDVDSEYTVQRAIQSMQAGRTTIVIAHRLSTIRNADTILFMRDGRIVEAGSHDELLARDGEYAAFYNLQLRTAEDDRVVGA